MILLVDGQPLLYRAASAYPGLRTPNGPTGVIVGTIALLAQMVDKFKPTSLILFWDAKGRTYWRKKLFPGYKASRKLKENTLPVSIESMLEQAEVARKLLSLVGVLQVSVPGVEADDLISLAVSHFKGEQITIASGDRDFCQLLEDGVTLFDPVSKRELTRFFVKADIGAEVNRWVDHAALCGAAGDDIPHPPGVGAVKATEIVTRYPSLESIFDDPMLGSSREKWKRDLLHHRETLMLARTLIKLPSFSDPGELAVSDGAAIRDEVSTMAPRLATSPLEITSLLDFHDLRRAGGQIRSVPTYADSVATLAPFIEALGRLGLPHETSNQPA